MAFIKTFNVKAVVSGNGTQIKVNKLEKFEIADQQPEEFDDKLILRKAEEIAQFNRDEETIAKSFGDGDVTIEMKVIV